MNAQVEAKPRLAIKDLNALIFMGVVGLCGAYVMMKDTPVPKTFLIAMALFAGAFFLAAGLFRKETVLYLLVAYLPFAKQLPGNFDLDIPGVNLTNGLVFLSIVFWLRGWLKKQNPLWTSTALNVWIYVLLGVGLFSLFRSADYGAEFFFSNVVEFYRT